MEVAAADKVLVFPSTCTTRKLAKQVRDRGVKVVVQQRQKAGKQRRLDELEAADFVQNIYDQICCQICFQQVHNNNILGFGANNFQVMLPNLTGRPNLEPNLARFSWRQR